MTPMEADIMDTIILSGKIRAHLAISPTRNLKPIAAIFSALFSCSLYANVELSGSANADYIHQNVSSESLGNFSIDTLKIVPTFNATYQSPTLSGAWSSKLTYLQRSNDISDGEQSYTEYSYGGQWTPLERLLVISASGALAYRNTSSANYLVSDFLSNSDSLSKTRSNRILAQLNIQQGDWVALNGVASYSDVASERSSLVDGQALDNDTISLSGSASNGDKVKSVVWNVDGAYQNTDRAQNSSGSFITREGDAFLDALLYNDFGLRFAAQHEANQISNRDDTSSTVREYTSYGAGLVYRQSETRYIAVTFNRSNSSIEEDDKDFVGAEFSWALSSRTSIGATFGRRFYGDSASANIDYNSKHFRSSFAYSEEVTNTSRLLSDPESLGVFVCPISSASISECFQPNSLSYSPTASEQLVEITSQNLEFDDSIILRKGANAQAGYSFSRLTLGLSWRYAEDDYLDQDRLRRTYSFGTSLAYSLGSYTTLSTNITFANIEQRSGDISARGETDNWNSSVSIQRELGRHLVTSLQVTVLDQSGDLNFGIAQFGNNYKDRRITASLTYTFD